MTARAIIIRADGSTRYGMGHVTRCLALAEALRERRVTVGFVSRDLPGAAPEAIRERGFSLEMLPPAVGANEDAQLTSAVARACGAHGIVIDLGHADTLANRSCFVRFIERLRDERLKTIVVEGLDSECVSREIALPAAAIVVPYFHAEKRQYKVGPGGKLLAGAWYFPFRAEFARAVPVMRETRSVARRLLISFGGGDVARYNEKTLRAIALLDRGDLEVRVTGRWQPDPVGDLPFQVESIERSDDMAKLIAWADLAVVGSGLTRYETALLTTPTLIYSLKPDHVPMVEEFAASGAALYGGLINVVSADEIAAAISNLIEDKDLRQRLSASGARISDGQGALRLADAVLELTKP